MTNPPPGLPPERFNGKGIGTPLSARGFPLWTIYLMAIVGFLYILNPGAGIFEILPDNLPIVGNLDEGAAFMMAWYGVVEFFERRKMRRQ